MKKRIAALLCAALLVCQLAASPAQAVESVHFTAINDNMLPLSEENMPFWSNGYLYVDSSIFTMAPNTAGRVLGIYRSWNTAKKRAPFRTTRASATTRRPFSGTTWCSCRWPSSPIILT